MKLPIKASFNIGRKIKSYVVSCLASFYALNLCLHLKEEERGSCQENMSKGLDFTLTVATIKIVLWLQEGVL